MSEIVKQVDAIEEISGALIQHGPLNMRIYLMKLGDADPSRLVSKLLSLAKERQYTKIFAKISAFSAQAFTSAGFQTEACIPDFYGSQEDALFLGLYLDPTRQIENNSAELDAVLETARRQQTTEMAETNDKTVVRRCLPEDVEMLADIYEQTFPTYPFPIDNPGYLQKTMLENIIYFGVEKHGKLVAISSSELDESSQIVEMTDFATLGAWRGQGLAQKLLALMDKEALESGVRVAYTIARASSPGMNITFAKRGYSYAGRLINNTNISGEIQSMNVWYKRL